MPFWMNDNKLVVYTRRFSFVHKFFISVGILLAYICTWFYFFYLPVANKINLLQSQVGDLQNQELKFKNVVEVFEKERKMNDDLLLQFKKARDSFVDSKLGTDFLLKILAKNNISCSGVKPLIAKSKQDFIKDYFHISFKCAYKDFLAFCCDIHNEHMPIKFCYIKAVRWKHDKIKMDVVFRNVHFNGI